jgi:O-acetyl-ADP-ribose deacetylase (regulator of RNase III)
MSITYVKGDATRPLGSGVRLIAHIVNTENGWGAGFVVALSKRWKAPEARYRKWFKEGASAGFELGNIQLVLVEEEPEPLWVVNMIAQVGYGRKGAIKNIQDEGYVPPIRYEALRTCLEKVADQARRRKASIHMPRIGSGLAGGKWEVIEKIVEEALEGLPVVVYTP